jgi:hypothetical protein
MPGVGTRLLRLVACCAALASAAPAAADGGLEILAPAAVESESRLPLLEVRGRAGARAPRSHDVVIAIDLSDSSTASSGHDLDGDGPGGRTSPERLRELASRGADRALLARLSELDLEDSVLYAELAAAEVLIGRLDPGRFRVGLVAFSDGARVVAPLGSRRETLRGALDGLRREFWRDLRGTNFSEAIRVAREELAPPAANGTPGPQGAAEAAAAIRERSILLLSDGEPTLPVHGDRPRQFSIEAAQDAALADIRIYPFALGAEAEGALDVYRALAAITGGRFERIERPGDAIARLRRVDLADLAELRVENRTSGQVARALRVFPDGSFDAFVPLETGPNRLQVTAVAGDGSSASLERLVHYRPEAETNALRAELQSLLDELRRRTREVELWAEIDRGRSVPVRELQLDVEPPAPEAQ